MKILSYSDLHLVVNKRGNIDEILRVERLSPENYDCIVMPGDIVHYASTYESKENFDKVAKDLKRITGSTPVFYVLGNHDQKNWYFCSKGKDGKLNAGIRDALEKLDSLGNFTWLSNGKVFKYGEIELKGINNSPYYYKDHKETSLKFLREYTRIRSGASFALDCVSLLVVHDPKSIYRLSKEAGTCIEPMTDLVISGHMHSAITPNCLQNYLSGRGLIAPDKRLFPEFAYGVKEIDGTKFLINGAVNAFIKDEFINRLIGFSCTEIVIKPKVLQKRMDYTYR